MNIQKLVASLALATILLATGFSVCRQVVMEGMSCMHHSEMCQIPFSNHMDLFFTAHPTTNQGAAVSLLLSSLLVFFVARFFPVAESADVDLARLRVKIQNLFRYLAHTFTPLFLVLAFSKGILHSKRYA